MVLCINIAKYKVASKLPAYVPDISSLAFENACLKNTRKPLRKQKLKVNNRMRSLESILQSIDDFEIIVEIEKFYLKMKNKLPNENRRANFLAFKIKTGMYSVETDMQKIPRLRHTKNPKIRCIRV